MATFSDSSFSHSAYASFRPEYPQSLYTRILTYHTGDHKTCLDLGCGHGVTTRALSPSFDRVYGVDPSPGMIQQARSLSGANKNIQFIQSPAESLPFLPSRSIDLVTAGEAAHWFDTTRLFRELHRVVRPGGALAFWAYVDPVFVGYPCASEVLRRYAYADDEGMLGPHWPWPGRKILRGLLRDVRVPEGEWVDVRRVEYVPGVDSGEWTKFMEAEVSLGQCMEYVRTWSAYHGWKEAHPDQKRVSEGGEGDVVDRMLEDMAKSEEGLRDDPTVLSRIVQIEWSTVLILARKV